MKPLGRKQTKTRVEGHQECGVCHPETKNGKTRERRRLKGETLWDRIVRPTVHDPIEGPGWLSRRDEDK